MPLQAFLEGTEGDVEVLLGTFAAPRLDEFSARIRTGPSKGVSGATVAVKELQTRSKGRRKSLATGLARQSSSLYQNQRKSEG